MFNKDNLLLHTFRFSEDSLQPEAWSEWIQYKNLLCYLLHFVFRNTCVEPSSRFKFHSYYSSVLSKPTRTAISFYFVIFFLPPVHMTANFVLNLSGIELLYLSIIQCPARSVVCHNSGKSGHFAKVCKSASIKNEQVKQTTSALLFLL